MTCEGDGIATVAWSSVAAAKSDINRDAGWWTLIMRRHGGTHNITKEVEFKLPPGTAYIICGKAQGTTAACDSRKGGHAMCTDCWQHSVKPVQQIKGASVQVRHSITVRAYASVMKPHSVCPMVKPL